MDALRKQADQIAEWSHAPTRFTRFRGDGWQIYLDFPGLVLRSCLGIAARLRASGSGLTTRISVGIETVDYLSSSDLSDARGDAFILSGQGLDEMPKSVRWSIDGRRFVPGWQTAIFDIAEWHTTRWTPEQAEAVLLALEPSFDLGRRKTQTDFANLLGISRQAWSARYAGSGLDAWQNALHAFEAYDFPDLTAKP